MFYIQMDDGIKFKERYSQEKFIEYDETWGCYDTLTSYFLDKIKELPIFGTYVVQKEAHRPDLVSYSIYGKVQYWWIVLAYNNLSCHMQLEAGLTISYPNLDDLEDVYFQLAMLERTRNRSSV